MGGFRFRRLGLGDLWDVAIEDVLTLCVSESFSGGVPISGPFKGVGGGWGGLGVRLDGYGGGVWGPSDSGDGEAA